MKKLLCVSLCLIILLGMLPMGVFAAETDVAKIMADAFALQSGQSMAYESTLTGKVISIDTPYSVPYKNITVTIEVSGYPDKPIQCYRLKDGAAAVEGLDMGAKITVTGTIMNYYGKVEFGQGCVLDAILSEGVSAPEDPKQIVEDARVLGENESLPYLATLTGKVISIDQPYDDLFKYVTLTMSVEGNNGSLNIVCYRMKGSDTQNVAAGDTITVNGVIRRYVRYNEDTGERTDRIEFDTGCELISWIPGGTVPTDPKQIVDEAYALGANKSLLYVATLTGKVISIDEPYSDAYRNITVTMVVAGRENKPIECYRLSGNSVADIKVGDTITVTGLLKRYVNEEKDIDMVEFYNCKLLEYAAITRTLYVQVPDTWNRLFAYTWEPTDLGDWPGTALQKNGDWYTATIKGSTENLVLSDGTDIKKTPNITLPKGFGDLWIAVDHLSGFTIYKEEPDLRTYTLRVEVPRSWGNTVSVYSWAPDVFGDWPGTPMVFNGDCYEITLPASVQNLMINDYVGSTGNKSNSLLIEPNQDVYIVIHASGEVDIYNGHGAHDYRSVNVPACCTVGAHTAMVCQVCGAEKPGSASAVTSPALGHDYRTTVVAPTCTDSGYTLHTCARCQESYAGGTSQPLGHYFANYISNDDATCTADGTKTGYCIRCEQKCTVADPDSALGHQFTHYMDDMNATCSADGTKTAKCDRCSATDTVAAPGSALGHQYVNGFCYYCGTAQLFDQGDVNGDGKINMADVAKTFAHVRGKSKITNENILLSADLNKDGKINIGDVARLYAIVRGKQVF